MGDQKGVLLYTGDALTAGANGATKALKLNPAAPRHGNCHVYIEADAAVTAATTVTIQGRVNSSAAWVTAKKQDDSTSSLTSQASGVIVDTSFPVQLFPEMRAVIAGTFAATVGTDVRVWVQADQSATRADS